MLEEHPLDSRNHDRKAFTCGVEVLDNYLRNLAVQHKRKGVNSVYVLTDSHAPERILGYYTLSAAQVDVGQLPEQWRKRLPTYPIPCFRMGRFACSQSHQGMGLGKLLLGCAVDRCLNARKQVAAYALLVDAKDVHARAFYEHYGFTRFSDQPLTLFLPLGKL